MIGNINCNSNNINSSCSIEYDSSYQCDEYSESIIKPKPVENFQKRKKPGRSKNWAKVDLKNISSLKRRKKFQRKFSSKNYRDEAEKKFIKLKSLNRSPKKRSSPVRKSFHFGAKKLRSIKSQKYMFSDDKSSRNVFGTKKTFPPPPKGNRYMKKSLSISPTKKSRDYRISTVKKYKINGGEDKSGKNSSKRGREIKRSTSFSPVKKPRKFSRKIPRLSSINTSHRKQNYAMKNSISLRLASVEDYTQNIKKGVENFTTCNTEANNITSHNVKLEEVWR